MNVDPALTENNLGSPSYARQVYERALDSVPAYRMFLEEKIGEVPDSFHRLPVMDKDTYIDQYPYQKQFAGNFEDTFSIIASSGSVGDPHYWPLLRENHANTIPEMKRYLERFFDTKNRSTLAIVGLSLGSWIGGSYFSWALKNVGLQSSYPFAVYSPGNDHEEIVRMVEKAEQHVEQILLFVCPSAIGHLKHMAASKNIELPSDRMRYIVVGEAFPESFRDSIEKDRSHSRDETGMYSVYGAADTGLLGVESELSVAVRKVLAENQELREDLGISSPVPHFFHKAADNSFLECVDEELYVTRWQGIPLVRYNLKDEVRLINWEKLLQKVRSFVSNQTGFFSTNQLLEQDVSLTTNVIAVRGRSDLGLTIGGTNLTESMLDRAVQDESLQDVLTGLYKARSRYREGRQFLEMDLELKQNVEITSEHRNLIYQTIINRLRDLQPEFDSDWNSVYHQWEDDPDKRILQLEFYSWPKLSNTLENQPKQRGVET